MRGIFRLVKTAADPDPQGGEESPVENPTPRPLRARSGYTRPQEFWKEVLRADGEDIGDIISSVHYATDVSRIVDQTPPLAGMSRGELKRFLLLIRHVELLRNAPYWRDRLYDLELQLLQAVTPPMYDESPLVQALVRRFAVLTSGVLDRINPTLIPQLEDKYAEAEAGHLVATGDLKGDLPIRRALHGETAAALPKVILRAFIIRARGEGTFGHRGGIPWCAAYLAEKMLLEGYPPLVTAADAMLSDPDRLFGRWEGKGWVINMVPILIGRKILSGATEEALVRWWETYRYHLSGSGDSLLPVIKALDAVRDLHAQHHDPPA